MEPEQFTEEQAQKLLEETMLGTAAPAPTPEPVEPPASTPVEPVESVEPVEPVTPTEPTEPATPAKPEKEGEQPTDPYAWINDIPESVRDKVISEINEKFQFKHQADSNKGRLKAFQQKLLEAQQQLAVHGRPASPAKEQPAPADRRPPSTPEGWNELIKSDPELAKAIEARVSSEIESAVQSVKAEFQELKKTAIAPLYDLQTQQYVEQQRQELERMVPNVHQVIASPEYQDWLNNAAPEGLRNLALRSVNAADAVAVLRAYRDDMIAMYGNQEQPNPVAAAPDTSKADKVAAERAAKLQTPTVVPPAAPLAPVQGNNKGPMTADAAQALFEAEYKKLMSKKT